MPVKWKDNLQVLLSTHTSPLPCFLKTSFHWRAITAAFIFSLQANNWRTTTISLQQVSFYPKDGSREQTFTGRGGGGGDPNREEKGLTRELSSSTKTQQREDFHRLVSSSQYTLINISTSVSSIIRWRFVMTQFLKWAKKGSWTQNQITQQIIQVTHKINVMFLGLMAADKKALLLQKRFIEFAVGMGRGRGKQDSDP